MERRRCRQKKRKIVEAPSTSRSAERRAEEDEDEHEPTAGTSGLAAERRTIADEAEHSEDEDEDEAGPSVPIPIPIPIPPTVAEAGDDGREDPVQPTEPKRSAIVPTLVPYKYEGANKWYLGIIQANDLMYIASTGATAKETNTSAIRFTMQEFVNAIKPKITLKTTKSILAKFDRAFKAYCTIRNIETDLQSQIKKFVIETPIAR